MQKSFPRPRLSTVVMVLLLAGLAGLGAWLAPRLRTAADVVLPIAACDPGLQECRVALPDGRTLGFTIAPRPIVPLRPLELTVLLDGPAPQEVRLDLNGADMEMGLSRAMLHAEAPGRYVGRTSLPLCVTGRMRWQATLHLRESGGTLSLPFQFYTEH
jgi:hypothetical protein